MKLSLPSEYLSYSQLSMWKKNKAQYRKIYYEKGPRPISPELLFGKQIAKRLEENDPALAHILRYSVNEKKLLVSFGDFEFLAYLDTFCPERIKFADHKTGREPWDAVRVHQHEQLDVYSLLLQMTYGRVDEECHIVWLPTRKVERTTRGFYNRLDGCIELTGEVVSPFPRIVTQRERDWMHDCIITSAREISHDYQNWKEEHGKQHTT